MNPVVEAILAMIDGGAWVMCLGQIREAKKAGRWYL